MGTREGWTKAAVGCYWTRGAYTIATIRQGNRRGYTLTHHRQEIAVFVSWSKAAEIAYARIAAGA